MISARFIALGHQHIALLNTPDDLMFSHHRLQGYKAALAAANMPFDPVLVVEPLLTEEAGAAATLKLLARDDPPTSILCGNDLVAMGAMRAISETGRFPG